MDEKKWIKIKNHNQHGTSSGPYHDRIDGNFQKMKANGSCKLNWGHFRIQIRKSDAPASLNISTQLLRVPQHLPIPQTDLAQIPVARPFLASVEP